MNRTAETVSTPRKFFSRFFHAMENIFPRRGKPALGALLAAVLAWGCQSAPKPRVSVPRTKRWTVTASGFEAGFEPRRAVDGQTNTWWRSGSEEPQWIQVDLGRPAVVCGFSLQWGRPPATEYSVRTSLDGAEWTLAYETLAGDGDWDQVTIEPTDARYVRLTVDKGLQDSGAALCALEIKGLETQPSIRVDGQTAPGTAAILDGDPETVWRCAAPAAEVELDLRRAKPVGSVQVDWGANGHASNVVVETSTNRTDWTSVGRIQSKDGTFDVLMGEEVRPARYVRLSFSGASSPDGFEVAGLILRGEEGLAKPWAAYELAASRAPDGIYPDVLRRRQTYWAVAGGTQRGDAESLLDEWGVFAPRHPGPSLAPLIESGGQVWTAHQAERIEHRLGGDGAPMPETVWRMPSGLSLRIRAAARAGGKPPVSWIQYELANDSIMAQTGRLGWVVRPLAVPPAWAGGGFAPIYRIAEGSLPSGGREIRVNQVPLFATPSEGLSFGAATFAEGDVAEFFLRGETPPQAQAARDDAGLTSAAWWMDFALAPGDRTGLVVMANAQMPTGGRSRRFSWPAFGGGADTVSDAFDRDWVDAEWAWRGLAGGYSPKIARPDAMDALRAQLGWTMAVRSLAAGDAGENLESIAFRVAALLRAGQPEAAREWIERVSEGVLTNGWVPAFYRADGRPAVRLGQMGRHAAQGQFAFMVMEYHRFTQDSAFLYRQYPALRRALGYLRSLRTETEKTEGRLPDAERDLLEGLVPSATPRPGHPRPEHLYADQYWALLGWKEGRAAASLLGANADVEWANRHYLDLKSAVRRSLRERMDRMAAAWIPASAEEERFDPASVALLFWPCEERDLVEPHELQSSLDAFYEAFLRRGQPDGSGIAPSDESCMLVPLSTMGRGDYAREVLYALLDRRHPAGWHAWPDGVGSDPRQPMQAGPMPDVRSAAAYYVGVRALAVRENGKRLDLFCGAPAEWLQHGDGFQVFGMATAFGPLDLSGFWNRNRFVVQIGGGAQPPGGYRLWWPRQIAPERVLANGAAFKDFDAMGANLPHDFQGTVDVQFPFMAPWPRDP